MSSTQAKATRGIVKQQPAFRSLCNYSEHLVQFNVLVERPPKCRGRHQRGAMLKASEGSALDLLRQSLEF